MFADYLMYIEQLKKVCSANKHQLLSIGIAGGLPLYKVVTGNQHAPNTVCVCAGIHGNEKSGPLTVLDFLSQYRPNKNDPKIIFFPVANPTGFNEDTYLASSGRNLNRDFGRKIFTDENHWLYSAIADEPISFFLSLHEDDELNGAYIHCYFDDKKIPKIYEEIITRLAQICPIYAKNRIHNYKANNGVVPNPASDGSFEDQMHEDGVKYSVCLEIPDRLPMAERITANLAVIKEVISFSKK